MRGTSFADESKELAFAERTSQIVSLRASGKSATDIAEAIGCDVRTVYRSIKDEAEKVRAGTAELVSSMFMLHQERLERLWAKAQERIDALEDTASSADFCHAVRAAIMILERQARLLGLDREKAGGRGAAADWLDTASEAELRVTAERYGLRIPEKLA
jgi:hypothetical protein